MQGYILVTTNMCGRMRGARERAGYRVGVTRIIAGDARGVALSVPKTGTRPTSDRVREAIFSSLDARGLLEDAAVLDLYAGTGALGLEAASRGAAQVWLVERAPKVAALIKRNAGAVAAAVERSGRRLRTHVIAASTVAFVERDGGEYDVIFADPPYEVSNDELTTVLEHVSTRLAPGARIVIERDTRSGEPALPAGLELESVKRYGGTAILVYAAAMEPPADFTNER